MVILALGFIAPLWGGILMLIAFSYVFLSWLLRSDSRPCPRCGGRVENGVMECPRCAFDFQTIGSSRVSE